MRGAVCGALGAVCVVLGAVGVVLSADQAPARVNVAAALDLYARGEHQTAVEARPFDRMHVVTVIDALEAWAGDAPDRRRMAARFAIDVTAHRGFVWMTYGVPFGDGMSPPAVFTIQGAPRDWSPPFDDQRFNAPIVAWACAQVPHTGPVEPWEPWWWLTSIAVLQEAGEWGVLQGSRNVHSGGTPPAWRRAVHEELDPGHLEEAHRRIGAHPRVRLAQAVTRAAALTDATRRGALGFSGPNVSGRSDVLRLLEEASRTVNGGRFAEVERDLEALLAEPAFEAEIALRIAQLRLLRREWAVANRWLDRAMAATGDRTLRATADYFRGWIFERTGRPSEALAAYRSAYAGYDLSPNLNTLLAAQLMIAGERAEAARVLERVIQVPHDHTWLDLWLLLVEGDAKKAGEYARRMREAR